MVIQVYGPRYPNKKTVTINPIWFHLAANVKLIISSNIRRACTVYYGAACPSCLFFLLLTEPNDNIYIDMHTGINLEALR